MPLGVEEPPARKAGVMVSGVDELVDRLKNEAHDNVTLKSATARRSRLRSG